MTSKVILKYDLSFSLKYCKIASIIKVLKITKTLPKFLYNIWGFSRHVSLSLIWNQHSMFYPYYEILKTK